MKKSILLSCSCLLIISCAAETPFIKPATSTGDVSAYDIGMSLGLDIRPYVFSAPEGFITEFTIETFNDRSSHPTLVYRGNYGPLIHKEGEPVPAHEGRVVFSIMPLNWVGEQFDGKARVTLSPCMNRPESAVIEHPFARLKGMGTVVGPGHWKTADTMDTFIFGSDELSQKEMRTFLCYYDGTSPRLRVSARLIPWPPTSSVESK